MQRVDSGTRYLYFPHKENKKKHQLQFTTTAKVNTLLHNITLTLHLVELTISSFICTSGNRAFSALERRRKNGLPV